MQAQVEQLYTPLLRYVKNRIRNKEDAEDITQEVFYKLSKLGNDDIDNLESLIFTIAKNTITDHYRKHKPQMVDLENNPVWVEEEAGDAARALSNCITSYIDALPQEYRYIMRLSELENVSQKEIAQTLGMNYVTVRSKIQRGRKKLKDMLSECCTIVQGGKGSILEYTSKGDADEKCSSCN